MVGKRLLLSNFISPELCKELIFIHKSCGVVGYRPHVFSTTLSHLVATNCAALLMPFIALREKVKEAVEEYFGCEFELFIEFTGMISWTKGANIGWHSDDNRNYLQQRHFSAVCYLNTFETDFHGGLFHFQDGELSTVVPTIGNVLIYSANEDNIHRVDEVTEGERFTMALWFTRDRSHDEDHKLLRQLFENRPRFIDNLPEHRHNQIDGEVAERTETPKSLMDYIGDFVPSIKSTQSFPELLAPMAASTNMYWVTRTDPEAEESSASTITDGSLCPVDNQGYDIRVARLASIGFQYLNEENGKEQFCSDNSEGFSDKPVKLVLEQQEIPYTFANSLHALHVAQFYEWRGKHLTSPCGHCLCGGRTDFQPGGNLDSNENRTFKRQRTSVNASMQENEDGKIYTSNLHGSHQVHVGGMVCIVKLWEIYMTTLWQELAVSLQAWKTSESLTASPQEGG